MSRLIIDSIVEGQFDNLFDKELLSLRELYSGEVKTFLKKIEINRSIYGLMPFPLTDTLEKNYMSLDYKEEKCLLKLPNGVKKEIEKNTFRILSTLAMEQVTECSEYAMVIINIFMQLLAQCDKKDNFVFLPKESFTWMQMILNDIVVEFVLDKLGQNIKSKVLVEQEGE